MKCFYFDAGRGVGVPRSEAPHMDRDAIIAEWDSLSNEVGSFLGIIRPDDFILQFIWEEPDRVVIDVPMAETRGSLTKDGDFYECRELISQIFDGKDLTALKGLRFVAW